MLGRGYLYVQPPIYACFPYWPVLSLSYFHQALPFTFKFLSIFSQNSSIIVTNQYNISWVPWPQIVPSSTWVLLRWAHTDFLSCPSFLPSQYLSPFAFTIFTLSSSVLKSHFSGYSSLWSFQDLFTFLHYFVPASWLRPPLDVRKIYKSILRFPPLYLSHTVNIVLTVPFLS